MASTDIFNKNKFPADQAYELCYAIANGDPVYVLLMPEYMKEKDGVWTSCPYIANNPTTRRTSIYVILGGIHTAQAFTRSCCISYHGESPLALMPTDRKEILRILFGLLTFDVDLVTVYDERFRTYIAEEIDILFLIQLIGSMGLNFNASMYSKEVPKLPMIGHDKPEK